MDTCWRLQQFRILAVFAIKLNPSLLDWNDLHHRKMGLTAKAQSECVAVQSEQGPYCTLRESLDTVKYIGKITVSDCVAKAIIN